METSLHIAIYKTPTLYGIQNGLHRFSQNSHS